MRTLYFSLLVLIVLPLGSCSRKSEIPTGGTVVVALPTDADVLNPILWSSSSTGTVLQFLFTDLTDQEFDSSTGLVLYKPHLAKAWEWTEDGRSLTIHLRSDVRWSDGVPITARDIRHSYERYANPKSGSVRRNSLIHFPRKESGDIDFDRAITIPNDSTISFHFREAYERRQQLNHAGLNFLPYHVWEPVHPDSLRTSPYNTHPVTGNHFVMKKWIRKQEIVLERDPNWTIPHPAFLDRIVFRILPDMSTRIIELKTGGVDFVEGLSPDEAREIMKNGSNIRIERQSYRRFDYLGWSNIDREAYSAHKIIRPHPLFGDRRVRRALTMAIHRTELIESWLGEFGQACEGPVSPSLRWAYNDTIRSLPYAPDSARSLLEACGWKDHDGDGILDRDGRRMEFTIATNTGNPRREFALQKIQADLKKMGILCRAQFLESNQFSAGLRRKEFDAFIAGMSTNLFVELQGQLGSDLERNAFNYSSYQNPIVDSLLNASASKLDVTEAGPLLKKIQAILEEDQPMTYLFWFDNIVGVNNRLKGTQVDMVSAYHRYYNWYVIPNP